uniref:Uncharacterized protein n=1 Tax=Spironucleus salmonicida TaxID=348837 RepID=V6LW82_9EUKA|eukprot:EST48825.1 Hypothetical protein SS50377_10921 [Spironucleus salmonicida]
MKTVDCPMREIYTGRFAIISYFQSSFVPEKQYILPQKTGISPPLNEEDTTKAVANPQADRQNQSLLAGQQHFHACQHNLVRCRT